MAPYLNSNPVELILKNQSQRVNITLVGEDRNPSDATELTLEVQDIRERVIYTDDYFDSGTRIIKPTGTTGQYYLDWGDPTAAENTPAQTETNRAQDIFFIWRGVGTSGEEEVTGFQVVKIIAPLVLSYLPRFRLQIDKAAKIIEESTDTFLGYTDAMLLLYMEGGLNLINDYQPATSLCLEDFPFDSIQLLLDMSTIVALESQAIFAIDTDIPAYSDQGYSFAIDHFPKLAQLMSTIQSRIDRLVPLFKLRYAPQGSLHVQSGVSYRLTQLARAAPTGSLFRGWISS